MHFQAEVAKMVTALVWKTWDVSSSLTFGTLESSLKFYRIKYAGIAQLVERLLAKEKVAGSNPVSRSFLWPNFLKSGFVAQLVRALGLHPKG